MNKPTTKPQVDADGRIWADKGPNHYLLHILENGDEWLQLETNAAWQVNKTAERRSLSDLDPEDGLVVRADTHEAIYYYKAGEGFQEGWAENDPEKAARRKKAYEKGERIFSHHAPSSETAAP